MSVSEDDKLLRQVEHILKVTMYEIVDSIKAAISGNIGLSPQMLYGPELDPILRSSAETAYTFGTTHAAKAAQQEGYLTHSDIDAIVEIARQHAMRFWTKVEMGIINKERQRKALEFTDQTLTTHLSNAWIVDAIASSLIYTAYNQAVKTKASKIR